jgi:hypothetical protein
MNMNTYLALRRCLSDENPFWLLARNTFELFKALYHWPSEVRAFKKEMTVKKKHLLAKQAESKTHRFSQKG